MKDANVINYVLNQEYHHQRFDFITECKEFLDEFEVDYDEQYIFKPLL